MCIYLQNIRIFTVFHDFMVGGDVVGVVFDWVVGGLWFKVTN